MANSSAESTPAGNTDPSRRQFFSRAGLAAAGLYALAAPTARAPWLARAEAADAKRAYVPGRFALELDGVYCGIISSFEGGNYTADIVIEKVGTDMFPRKHLGGLKIEPITVETSFEMSSAWFEWITKTLNGEYVRKNGAVIESDLNYREIGRRSFMNALIQDVEFPACNASSREAGRMTVSFAPEQVKMQPGSGKPIQQAGGAMSKQWIASNFRLNIQGLEQATQRATKVDAFSISRKIIADSLGTQRDPARSVGTFETSNLVFTVPEAQAGLLYAWYDDFLIKGNNGAGKERQGLLEFLTADRSRALATLQLSGLGVFKVSSEGATGQDKPREAKVEVYCQRITAKFTP